MRRKKRGFGFKVDFATGDKFSFWMQTVVALLWTFSLITDVIAKKSISTILIDIAVISLFSYWAYQNAKKMKLTDKIVNWLKS